MADRAPALLLIPGAWHGAWSWSALQRELDLLGVASYALDLPGRGASAVPPTGLAGDADAIVQAIAALDRPTLLVAHSYGGAPAGDAAVRAPGVLGVVYIAAFALRAGESVNGFLRAAPRHRVLLGELMRPADDGSLSLDPERAGEAYGSLPPAEVAAHVARLSVQPAGTFTGLTGADPFGALPTTYVMCDDDDAVHVEHQRILAERCDRSTVIGGGHFPMFTRPAELARTLADELALVTRPPHA